MAAPTILGKGLTLQIGDTSEEWNQLNVAVQDMHAANLGIGNLKIDTEEAAQAGLDGPFGLVHRRQLAGNFDCSHDVISFRWV